MGHMPGKLAHSTAVSAKPLESNCGDRLLGWYVVSVRWLTLVVIAISLLINSQEEMVYRVWGATAINAT